ncbi:hypothetical protein [Methylobacterium radiodurans]|uniref:DUF2946 domain-containing protein n=1 Tax=Methylobacterium radiodurans TaxID=2202828 RepID=A0A2U8VNN3_9HYPH|nr:hypothetical protein [Methylobacterium radiodurans]AWN35160.1 hypothetical protein DK427_04900 [Methylobacterium radiodurans]
MSATRSLWRELLTIVQVVMFAAFSMAGAGHAHAGASHAGYPKVAVVDHSDKSDAELSRGLSDDVEQRDNGDASAAQCGMSCCCQASLARWYCAAVPVSWRLERTLAGIRVVAFDSVSPETLPEPPRTFA